MLILDDSGDENSLCNSSSVNNSCNPGTESDEINVMGSLDPVDGSQASCAGNHNHEIRKDSGTDSRGENESPVVIDLEERSGTYTDDAYVSLYTGPEKSFNSFTQNKYGRAIWAKVPIQKVVNIPVDINGTTIYNVKAEDRTKLLASCRDGRRWKRDSRTDWSGYSAVRYRDCMGSSVCLNNSCIFYLNYCKEQRNEVYFDKNGNCQHCQIPSEKVECECGKYTAFVSTTEADVYHYGEHRCVALQNKNLRPTEEVNSAMAVDFSATPSEIQSNTIIAASLLRERKSWEDVDNIVQHISSIRKISHEKAKQKNAMQPSSGFDALKELKLYMDRRDTLLIYDINRSEQYVFKTSQEKMKIAHDMNIDGDHYLKEDFCYFDGNHKRVRDFVTLTASMYHPLLQSQITLATMQCKHENDKFVEVFWKKFNEAYRTINDCNFNPIGWCTDMCTSNFNGIRAIYGEDVLQKMNGCEFHFNESVQKQAKSLDGEFKDTFLALANDLLRSTTPEAYNRTKKDFECFLLASEKTKDRFSWLAWWDERKKLMFKAFTSMDAPSSNLAEVVHAGWKNANEINLSLLVCAYYDVKDCLLVKQHLKDLRSGDYEGGRGPSQAVRQQRKALKDISTASQIGRDLLDYDVDMTVTPSMAVPEFLAEGSGCKPEKKNTVPQSKLFANRLESARNAKHVMKIVKIDSIDPEHCLYEIASKETARKFSQVNICTQPSCSCKDFSKFGSKVLCKHILFVLLFPIGITDLNILNSLDFQVEQIRDMLKAKEVDSQYMRNKKNATKRKRGDYQAILSSSPNYNDPQVFTYQLKAIRTAKCNGFNCSTIIQLGTPCVKVEGAISVLFGQDVAMKHVLYFCANRRCLSNPSVWTNVRRPENMTKGPNTSDAGFDNLKKDLNIV